MTSAEKLARFSESLLETEEVLPGALGAIQAAAAMSKMQGGQGLTGLLGTEEPAELDEMFLDIARFALWVRSDDASPATLEDVTRAPQVIADLLNTHEPTA